MRTLEVGEFFWVCEDAVVSCEAQELAGGGVADEVFEGLYSRHVCGSDLVFLNERIQPLSALGGIYVSLSKRHLGDQYYAYPCRR
jgi:hypothetical protein